MRTEGVKISQIVWTSYMDVPLPCSFFLYSPFFAVLTEAIYIVRKGTLGTTLAKALREIVLGRRKVQFCTLGMTWKSAITCADFIAPSLDVIIPTRVLRGKKTSLPSFHLLLPSVRSSLKTFHAVFASGQKGRLSRLAPYLPIAQDLKECSARTRKLPVPHP